MLIVVAPDEAVRIIEDAYSPSPSCERVPLDEAIGRVAFSSVAAAEDVPMFDRSTVDGYAVRAADTFGCSEAIPAILKVVGSVSMGRPADIAIAPGECVAIPTGGELPKGADAVVMVEHTERFAADEIGASRPAAPGDSVIMRGDDVRRGGAIIAAGTRIGAAAVGALAASGAATVDVCRRPSVAVISTGDELVSVDAAPELGQVRDVNSHILRALITDAGGQPVMSGIVRDDADALQGAIDSALRENDVVVISGGSSVGERDATRAVIERRGRVLFHGVAMRPGKPTMFGIVDDKPVWGLPGHPLAAYFTASRFVMPTVAKMAGAHIDHRTIRAVITENVSANDGRELCLAVRLLRGEGEPRAVPIRSRSGLITSLAGADGWLTIPAASEGVSAGSSVIIYLF